MAKKKAKKKALMAKPASAKPASRGLFSGIRLPSLPAQPTAKHVQEIAPEKKVPAVPSSASPAKKKGGIGSLFSGLKFSLPHLPKPTPKPEKQSQAAQQAAAAAVQERDGGKQDASAK